MPDSIPINTSLHWHNAIGVSGVVHDLQQCVSESRTFVLWSGVLDVNLMSQEQCTETGKQHTERYIIGDPSSAAGVYIHIELPKSHPSKHWAQCKIWHELLRASLPLFFPQPWSGIWR